LIEGLCSSDPSLQFYVHTFGFAYSGENSCQGKRKREIAHGPRSHPVSQHNLHTYCTHRQIQLQHQSMLRFSQSSGPPGVSFQPLGLHRALYMLCVFVCTYTHTYTHIHSHPRQKIEKSLTTPLTLPLSQITLFAKHQVHCID